MQIPLGFRIVVDRKNPSNRNWARCKFGVQICRQNQRLLRIAITKKERARVRMYATLVVSEGILVRKVCCTASQELSNQ